MFVVQAHSFTQQARLAITLAWVAGYTNILTILTCGHVTSHVSGTASDLGRHLAESTWGPAGFALFLLITFVSGAAISGLSTELARRKGRESIYVLPMAIEACLLAAFAISVELHEHAKIETGRGLYFMTGVASLAMGLQNATITRISSGVVRTTHVTGVLTDLGLELVQFFLWLWDRRRDIPPGSARGLLRSARVHPTATRLALLGSIVLSFALGAALGTTAYRFIPTWAMFPPVLFLAWIIFQDIVRPIVEIEPSELVGAGGLDLDKRLAVFHLRREKDRHGQPHRMPNLLAWAGRLPDHVRVIILDLEDVRQIDPNSALEVVALLRLTARQGRELILAGLTTEQFRQLARAGAAGGLDPRHVCPDLELAIARGLNFLEEMGIASPPPPRTDPLPLA